MANAIIVILLACFNRLSFYLNRSLIQCEYPIQPLLTLHCYVNIDIFHGVLTPSFRVIVQYGKLSRRKVDGGLESNMRGERS